MTRQLSPPTAKMQNITGVVPTNKGGTGGTDSESVAASIGGIGIGSKGLPNGAAILSSDIKVMPSQMPLSSVKFVTLKGPTEVAVSQAAVFTITNFDSKTVYAVSATAGTVAVAGNTIVFNAPSTAQTATLNVNGRTVDVSIVAVRPIKPVIAVVDFGIGASAALIITAKAFSMLAGANTHQSTDWEVSLTGAFTNTVFSSYNDAVNKLSIATTELTSGNTYFVRARFKDSSNNLGSWSKVISIKVKNTYKIDKLLSKTVAADRSANDNYGYDVCVSGDGKRLAVGAWQASSGGTSFVGSVYVYLRSGQSWIFEAKLYPNDMAVGDRFGKKLSFNKDGSRLAISAESVTTSSSAGAVYIFLRSNVTWVQESKIMAADRASGDLFGYSLSINSDGTRLAIGAPAADVSSVVDCGAVYIYSRSGVTWSLETKISAVDKVTLDQLGTSVAISDDASRLAIGAPGVDFSGVTNCGSVYIFTRSGVTWTQEAKLVSATRTADDALGTSVAMSSDASRVISGAIGAAATTSADTCFAIVFTRTNATWVQEVKLQASDRIKGDDFGSSVTMNSDGTRAVIGARFAEVQAVIDAGSAYVFTRTLTNWLQESKLTAIDKTQTARFGNSLSISRDASIVAIGARFDDPAGVTNAGSVYTFGT